ncbi:hypothetical protein [Providencia huaxiensis]|uniref:hypothetical protein n=1 Tax=Providencia huaxiensis TaxID=2027290 RepID=UPI001EE79A42|nr:hypothetical protein [Providencia huaxiensis]
MSDKIKEMETNFCELGLSWMNKDVAELELNALISALEEPQKTLNALEIAQWHYMDLLGITSSGLFDENTLSREQKKYVHLIKKQDGLSVFEDDQCVIFMSEKHNLPIKLCAAYVCSHSW